MCKEKTAEEIKNANLDANFHADGYKVIVQPSFLYMEASLLSS